MLTKLQDWVIKKVFESKLLGWLSGSKRDLGNLLLLFVIALTGLMNTFVQLAVVYPEWSWVAGVVGLLGAAIRVLGDMHAQAKQRAGE